MGSAEMMRADRRLPRLVITATALILVYVASTAGFMIIDGYSFGHAALRAGISAAILLVFLIAMFLWSRRRT